jgi:RNA polymerase sigma-70 factor (ECF subfamily)
MALGEQEALSRLYDETAALIHGLALRILRDSADAEEVTADVFAQAWRSSSSFDAARGNPMSWLVMMTRSRAIDRLRSRDTRRRVERTIDDAKPVPDSTPGAEQRSIASQQQRLVRNALAELADDQRELIRMAFYQGLSHSELAEKTGLPLGTVKTRIRLGMMKLRARFEAHQEGLQ